MGVVHGLSGSMAGYVILIGMARQGFFYCRYERERVQLEASGRVQSTERK